MGNILLHRMDLVTQAPIVYLSMYHPNFVMHTDDLKNLLLQSRSLEFNPSESNPVVLWWDSGNFQKLHKLFWSSLPWIIL